MIAGPKRPGCANVRAGYDKALMIEKRRRKLCDRSTMGIGLRGPFVVVTTLATLGCGPSPITSARIEGAIAPTFANLVQVHVSRLGLPSMAASDFAVTALVAAAGTRRYSVRLFRVATNGGLGQIGGCYVRYPGWSC
jgi:hypothetical protein